MVLFLVLLIPGAWGITSNSASNVNVTLMSQPPDPAEPGQIVTVKFKVENAGMQTNSKALAIIHPQYPFSLYGDKAEKDIGMLLAASTGNDAVVVEYKLKVDEQAAEGDRPGDPEQDAERRHGETREQDPERPDPESAGDVLDGVGAQVGGLELIQKQRHRVEAHRPHHHFQCDSRAWRHNASSPLTLILSPQGRGEGEGASSTS